MIASNADCGSIFLNSYRFNCVLIICTTFELFTSCQCRLLSSPLFMFSSFSKNTRMVASTEYHFAFSLLLFSLHRQWNLLAYYNRHDIINPNKCTQKTNAHELHARHHVVDTCAIERKKFILLLAIAVLVHRTLPLSHRAKWMLSEADLINRIEIKTKIYFYQMWRLTSMMSCNY